MSNNIGEKLELLTFEETRVLGCLIEKDLSLSIKSMTLVELEATCCLPIQGDLVVPFQSYTVQSSLDSLLQKNLVLQTNVPKARVQKYTHNLRGKWPSLLSPTMSVLAVLLLSGPQTAEQLFERTKHMFAFSSVSAVEFALQDLIDAPQAALVVRIPDHALSDAVIYVHALSATPPNLRGVELTDQEWRQKMEQEIKELRAGYVILSKLAIALQEGQTVLAGTMIRSIHD